MTSNNRRGETNIIGLFLMGLAVIAAMTIIICILFILFSNPIFLFAAAGFIIALFFFAALCVGIGWLLQRVGWELER